MARENRSDIDRRPRFEHLEPRLLLDGTLEQQAIELFSISAAVFAQNRELRADEAVHYAFDGSGTNRTADAGGWTAPAPFDTNAGSDSGYDYAPQATTDGAGNCITVWESGDSRGGTIGSDRDVLSATSSQTFRDYGDAPLPYPTLLADVGARHEAKGPRLGAERDHEIDGQPTAGADGDDTTGRRNDEDGVTFGSTIMVGQLDASVTVNVQNVVDPRAGARLDAWIDFNADGTWGGPFEQIADNLAVHSGNNTIQFDVPSWAVEGPTYARFRLSTAGDLAPRGVGKDGEVEDYRVTITRPATSAGIFGSSDTISTAVSGPESVFAADVDGDGDMDVLSASFLDNKIAWYENDGSGGFTEHAISTTAEQARSVFAADVDGDGDMDVLSASQYDNKIAWYENDGSENFTEHAISTSAVLAYSVFAADVDGDGDMDVLSASHFHEDQIVWYENDGSEDFTAHTIATDLDDATSVFAVDVDGDGDMDVLSGFFNGDQKITWYENNGSQRFTEHVVSTSTLGATSVFAADVDGDGDMDFLSASTSYSSNKIAWYENDGSENFTARTISTAADWAQSVFAADMDGDGDMDP
jgi:hypothetical protein